MNIAFIGLGVMGAPMARNLIAAGHQLSIAERASIPADLRPLCRVLAPAEVAKDVEAVILMLPDTVDVEQALFGPSGIARGLSPGTLVIDMSTISPKATEAFAKRLTQQVCDYVDAPVSGGEVGAKAGTLTIMAGGSKAAFERARPLFEKLGKNVTHVSEKPGSGQVCKLANQIIVALNIEAVSEALTFVSKAGVDPATVRNALMGGFASSRILEVHAERMIKRQFAPGFRIALHQKDLRLALAAADELSVSLPNTARTQELFSSCAAEGGAELDHSYLVSAIERMSGASK